MITLTIGWLTLFLIGIDLFVVSPLLPQIAANIHVGVGSAGWMVSTFSLAYVFGGPAFGALADRFGRHRVLALSLTFFAVANILTGLAPSFPLLLATRALAGLSASGVTPSVYALVGAAAPRNRRATWLAVVTSGLLLALSTGVPAGALLADATGWRGVFIALSTFTIIVLALNIWAVAIKPANPDAGRSLDEARGSAHSPSLGEKLRAVSLTGAWGFAVYGVYTYLGAGLHQYAGLSSAMIAGVLSFYGVGALIGNLVGGPLADRVGARNATAASLIILAIIECLVASVISDRILLIPGLALLALVAYPFFSAQQTRLINSFPSTSGSLLAWNNTALYVGILVGSAAGGRILDSSNFATLIFCAAGIAMLAGLASPWTVTGSHAGEPLNQLVIEDTEATDLRT